MEYELIDFVKAHPILYKRQYAALKYAQQKMEKWRELGKKLKKDPNVLRLRWRGLRNHYAKKFRQKGVDEDDALGHAPRWQYYNHMKFLSAEYENLEVDQYISQDSQEDDEGNTNTHEAEAESFDLNEYIRKNDGSNKNQTNPNKSDDTPNPVKSRHLLKDHAIDEACREMSIMLQKAKQHILPPSHNQVFFNSLALQIEQADMMPMDQMRLQQKVLELVAQEILISQERT